MMRPGSGTGAAPTRRAAAVYDSGSAVAPGVQSVLVCCRTRADGCWAKMLVCWHGSTIDISAAAGIFQHALHSHPFIRETSACWRCVLYVSRVPVKCLLAQLAKEHCMPYRGTALPCNCRSFTGQQADVSGNACELFWQAPACLLCLFRAGGRTRDDLQPGSSCRMCKQPVISCAVR